MSEDQPRLPVCASGFTCAAAAGADPAPRGETAWRRVGPTSEVPRDGMKAFVVDGVAILVVDVDGAYAAVQALCPHEAIPLDRGVVAGSRLTCLEHMWQFDVSTGAALDEAEEGLRTFPLRTLDGDLYVAL